LYTQRDHISRYVWGVGRPCTHYECGSAYVSFAPKATEFLRGNEMTRWATSGLVQCSNPGLYFTPSATVGPSFPHSFKSGAMGSNVSNTRIGTRTMPAQSMYPKKLGIRIPFSSAIA
jgi:hypothetical protein